MRAKQKSCFLFATLTALISLASAQSLLNEQFSGSSLSPSTWTSSTPYSDSAVSVSSGILSLSNGAGILSTAGYSTPIDVTFAFAFTGGLYDSFRVYTRAGSFNANGYGVKGVGVSFRIQEDTGNLTGNIALEDNGAVLATGTVALARNTYYTIRLTDTGSSLSLFLNSSTSALLTAATSSSYGTKIVAFNRQGAASGSLISAGSVSSLDYLTVAVLPIPVVTAISAPRQIVSLGQSLALSVSVTSSTTISYQWKRNGLPIAGATAVTYNITNAAPVRDGGWYQVAVSNSSGTTDSTIVFVNVAVTSARVLGWGYNTYGQINEPAGLGAVTAISAGGDGHTVALKNDGTVAAWGDNRFGQTNVPAGLSEVGAIAAGHSFTVALKSNGTMVAWGSNDNGQTNIPAGLGGVVAIAAGVHHTLALKSDGSVVEWGDNFYGQQAMPAGLRNVAAVAAGFYHSLALKSDGTVVAWGDNRYGATTVPSGLNGVIAVVAGGYHSVALKSDGTVVAWGAGKTNADPEGYGQSAVPAGLNGVAAIAAGGNHTVALKNDGTIVAWGRDDYGQSTVPAGLREVAAIAAGVYHTVALVNAASLSVPAVTTQPANLTVTAGVSANLAVVATGTGPLSYQWRKNGVAIIGATNATLSLGGASSTSAGNYDVVVSNFLGTTTSSAATLTVEQSRLANVSVRTTLANAQSLIVGFSVSGGAKDVLVRAAGPALVPLGVTTAMTDPKLELYKDSTKLLENDNWPSALTNTFSSLGAFPFPANSRDAALLQTLSGSYSAVASGTGPGVVLVEAYDASSGSAARLVNLSARNRVGTGTDILIAGFYIAGTGTKRLLIRAVGPTIGGVPFNVPGTLVDPKLELYDASAVKIAENDTWDSSLAVTFASVGAFPLAPNSKDAALVIMLNAGAGYSVQVKGADGGTGEALVEIYELP